MDQEANCRSTQADSSVQKNSDALFNGAQGHGAMSDRSEVKGLKNCPRSFPVVLMSHFQHLSLPTNRFVFSLSSACSVCIQLVYFIALFGFNSEH